MTNSKKHFAGGLQTTALVCLVPSDSKVHTGEAGHPQAQLSSGSSERPGQSLGQKGSPLEKNSSDLLAHAHSFFKKIKHS